MKKIWLMLLMICSVCAFSACSDDDDDKKEGEDKENVCPVTDVVVPEAAEAEGTVTITGKGFATTAKILLQKEDETPEEVDASITSTEATFKVPASYKGDYKVILKQDGKEWNVGTINITAASRGLRVKQIIAENYDTYTYNFTYDDQNRIKNITRLMEGYEDELMSFDFTYEENRIIVSGWRDFSFNLTNGKVTGTIDEDGDESTWEYNSDDYLTYGGYEECDFEWDENNNLTYLYSNYDSYFGRAVFDNLELKNNISTIDIVPIMYNYYSYALANSDYDLIAYMLGISGNRSANLPSQMTNEDGDLQTITYKMDEEHPEYMSEASITFPNWEDEMVTYSIKIIYE